MGSGSSPLANRLVDLGAERIAARNKRPWTHSDETQYRLESRDVLAAALREVRSDFARENSERRRKAQAMHGSDLVAANLELARVMDVLADLADEIEKGE